MLGIIGAMDVEVKKLREMMEDPERRPMQPDFSGPVSCERDHKYWNCRFS